MTLFSENKYLRGCPLDRNLSSLRHIIVTVRQVSGHPKICNLYIYVTSHNLMTKYSLISSPCTSFDHPPGYSWQQGLCVQSSSWTGTPYLRQSDNSTPAAVEVVMVGPALLDCRGYRTNGSSIMKVFTWYNSHWSECV